MKVLKRLNGYAIVSLTDKDKEDHNVSSDFACILNDEMEFAASLREIDMECGSLQECIDFIG
jgi:hypothetical protein